MPEFSAFDALFRRQNERSVNGQRDTTMKCVHTARDRVGNKMCLAPLSFLLCPYRDRRELHYYITCNSCKMKDKSQNTAESRRGE